jgi:cytochrome c5
LRRRAEPPASGGISLPIMEGNVMQVTIFVLFGVLAAGFVSQGNAQSAERDTLQPPSAFQNIGDPAQRSRALFTEIGKVLTHARCMNCHPAGDQPLQGADHRIHFPPSHRPGLNVFGDACTACHTDRNFTVPTPTTFQSIPGHPRWELAPLSMAWEGKSLGEICRQLKDKTRNGGRDLAMLQEHIAKDDLVAWGWNPGAGREPAPGNQELAGRLAQAWIDSGAECP